MVVSLVSDLVFFGCAVNNDDIFIMLDGEVITRWV